MLISKFALEIKNGTGLQEIQVLYMDLECMDYLQTEK